MVRCDLGGGMLQLRYPEDEPSRNESDPVFGEEKQSGLYAAVFLDDLRLRAKGADLLGYTEELPVPVMEGMGSESRISSLALWRQDGKRSQRIQVGVLEFQCV